MSIEEVSWSEIEPIVKNYDLGGASFTRHKKTEVWFALRSEGDFAVVSKTLFVSKSEARICSIWTRPDLRRKGLGMMMINHQINHAKRSGSSVITAISKERLFENFGFKAKKTYAEGSSFWTKNL